MKIETAPEERRLDPLRRRLLLGLPASLARSADRAMITNVNRGTNLRGGGITLNLERGTLN